MRLLLTAEARKEIAATITYINVLPTCATIVFLGYCEQPEISNTSPEFCTDQNRFFPIFYIVFPI